MSNDFQPTDPHPDTDGPTGASRKTIVVVAVISALMVIMILAIGSPRIMQQESIHWMLTLGGGALTAIAILTIGFFRRSGQHT